MKKEEEKGNPETIDSTYSSGATLVPLTMESLGNRFQASAREGS